MYKTVRQGDASLQYTILPQIDEFYPHDVTTVRGSPPVKGHHCTTEDRFWLPSSRMLCFMLMSLMIIIIITCCVIATYVINAMIRGSCVVTTSQPVATVTNRALITNDGLSDDDENYESTDSMTTTAANTLRVAGMSPDNRLPVLSSRSSTSYPTTSDDEETSNFEFTIEETAPPSTEEARSTTHSSSTGSASTSTSPSLDPNAVSSDSRASIIEAPTNNIVNILKKIKMLKMPRITLKLRINDTIPQMYMKAGIASYKKGKITTSVLAQGLSLEGLIFKTPEGTIKPWRRTWPFDDSEILQRKTMFSRDIVGATMIISMLGLVFMLLRLFISVRRHRLAAVSLNRIEKAEIEYQDETYSILLDSQSPDQEDKE